MIQLIKCDQDKTLSLIQPLVVKDRCKSLNTLVKKSKEFRSFTTIPKMEVAMKIFFQTHFHNLDDVV